MLTRAPAEHPNSPPQRRDDDQRRAAERNIWVDAAPQSGDIRPRRSDREPAWCGDWFTIWSSRPHIRACSRRLAASTVVLRVLCVLCGGVFSAGFACSEV